MKFIFKKRIYSFLEKNEIIEINDIKKLNLFLEKCNLYLIKELEKMKEEERIEL